MKTQTRRVHRGIFLIISLIAVLVSAGPIWAATDRTPPAGSVAINDGAEFTRESLVTLNLSATDNSGSIVQVAASNDMRSWSQWQPVTSTMSWQLPEGDGLKTVYVTFRDADGNVSPVYSAVIMLDTRAPKIYDIKVYPALNSVRITWRTDEPAYSAPFLRPQNTPFKALSKLSLPTNSEFKTEHEVTLKDLRENQVYLISLYATDPAGNIGRTVEDVSFTTRPVDNNPPKGRISINGGDEYTNSSDVQLGLEANDDSQSAIEYSLSADGRQWDGWRPLEKERSYRLAPGDGTRTVYVRFRDTAGNVSDSYSARIIVDTKQPQIFNVKVQMLSRSTARITWQTSEPAYCTTQYGQTKTYRASNTKSAGQDEVFKTDHEVVIENLQAGVPYTVAIDAQDRAGNRARYEQTINGDSGAPTGSIRINNGERYTSNTTVTLTMSASDPDSGVAQMQFSNDGWSWSPWENFTTSRNWSLTGGDGAKTVYVRFRDAAGNESQAYSDTIMMDTRAPEIYNVQTVTVGLNSVRISWRTNEPTTGMVTYYGSSRYSPRSEVPRGGNNFSTEHEVTLTALNAGQEYHFEIQAADEAGNRSRLEDAFRLESRDTTPPEGQVIVDDGREYTRDRNVTVRVQARDDHSNRIEYQLSNDGYRWDSWRDVMGSTNWELTMGDGTKTIYARFRDEAGNVSGAVSATITLVTRGPQIHSVNVETISRSTVRISWRTDEVAACTLTVNGSRAGSQTAFGTEHSVVVSGLNPANEYRYNIQASDRAGNTANYEGRFRLTGSDTAAPSGTILINNGSEVTDRTQVMIQLTANDDQSTRIEYQLSNDARSWSNWAVLTSASVPWAVPPGDGIKTVYARFRDANGNVSPIVSDQITLNTRGPQISNVNVEILNPTQVRISWTTDKPTYGTVTFTGGRTTLRATSSVQGNYRTEHSVALNGLKPNTQYTFQIQAVDQAGRTGMFNGTFFTRRGDSVPPMGSIRLNGGAPTTTNTRVDVQMNVKGNSNGRLEYQLSNDGRTWGGWATVEPVVQWDLAPGNGLKIVYARFRDESGNVSGVVSAQITLTTATKKAPSVTNVSVELINPTTVRIRFKTDVPTMTTIYLAYQAENELGLMRDRKSTVQDKSYRTEHDMLCKDLIPGKTYTFRIEVFDQYGNKFITPESIFVTSNQTGSINGNFGISEYAALTGKETYMA